MSTPRVSSRSTVGTIDVNTGEEAPAKPFAVHFAKPVFVFFPDKPSRPESITRFRSDDERMRGSAWEVTSVGVVINGTTIPFGNIVCFGEGL
jgi:hypothetical protein